MPEASPFDPLSEHMSVSNSTTNGPVFGPLRCLTSGDATHATAILLFLEDADSIAVPKGTLAREFAASVGAPWVLQSAEWILDRAVRFAQTAPKVAHVEIVLVDDAALLGVRPAHFATYLADRAGWRDGDGFYRARRWRAIPLGFSIPAARLRTFVEDEVDAPYSIAQYLASFRGTELVRWLWEAREPGSAAHCATLSSRIVLRALQSSTSNASLSPSLVIPPNNWCVRPKKVLRASPCQYSPSRLFVECSALCSSQAEQLLQMASVKPSAHASSMPTEPLLEQWTLRSIPLARRRELLQHASWRVAHSFLNHSSDANESIMAQRALAKLVLQLTADRQEIVES